MSHPLGEPRFHLVSPSQEHAWKFPSHIWPLFIFTVTGWPVRPRWLDPPVNLWLPWWSPLVKNPNVRLLRLFLLESCREAPWDVGDEKTGSGFWSKMSRNWMWQWYFSWTKSCTSWDCWDVGNLADQPVHKLVHQYDQRTVFLGFLSPMNRITEASEDWRTFTEAHS